MEPIATVMTVCNSSYQKELVLLPPLRSAHAKFVEISIETFIQASLVLEFFSAFRTLTNVKKTSFFKETVYLFRCKIIQKTFIRIEAVF